jgi:ABC-2 type transport system permease protein
MLFSQVGGNDWSRAMNDLIAMLWIESRKALRSRMPLFTTLGSLFMPLGIAFIIFVSRNPQLAQKLGLISAKANLMAYAATNWTLYLNLLSQMVAAGGFILFCLIISWAFGREFVDGTVKDMLAVPVRRSNIVLAKFIVVAVWCAVLALLLFAVAVMMGMVEGLPEGSFSVMLQGAISVAITTLLVIWVVLPVGFFASVGRGYLLPMGATILILLLANLMVVAGWGEYFPWAVPMLYGQGKTMLTPTSYGVVILTGLLGMAATYFWWKYADQNR